jgi:hypothetical protein
MNVGMLWIFDKPMAGLVPNLVDAADHYRKKYGRVPDCCMVNPMYLAEPVLKVGVVTVKPMKEILPKSLWIGMEEKPEVQ